ncbi:MAG: Crp/Fnr family transcriptional regulator [bacterium]
MTQSSNQALVLSSADASFAQQSQLFAALPPTLLADMSAQFRQDIWAKNHYIAPQILQQRFHIILDGRLEVKRSNPETGRELTLDVLQAGDSFDVITLLDDQPHEVTLSPLSKLVLLSVPMATMRQWLWMYPALNRQFMQYLAQKMRAQEDLSSSLVLQDVATRLGRLILKNLYPVPPQSPISPTTPTSTQPSQTSTGTSSLQASRSRTSSQTALIPALSSSHGTHPLTINQTVGTMTSHPPAPPPRYHSPVIKGLSDEMIARMIGSARQVVNKQLQHWKSEGIIDKKRNQLIIHDVQTIRKVAQLDD